VFGNQGKINNSGLGGSLWNSLLLNYHCKVAAVAPTAICIGSGSLGTSLG
jgi:hypothetical protein